MILPMKYRHLLALALAGILATTPGIAREFQLGSLKIEQPWVRPTVPGQSTGGAYLSVSNAGPAADRLLGGSSAVAARVEVHEMRMEGNVMRMRELTAVDLPVGTRIQLAPGGLHLMLIDLKAPLKIGDKVPLTLRFEKAGEIDLLLQVANKPVASSDAHKH
jgi:periplasmic copper chaperone A